MAPTELLQEFISVFFGAWLLVETRAAKTHEAGLGLLLHHTYQTLREAYPARSTA